MKYISCKFFFILLLRRALAGDSKCTAGGSTSELLKRTAVATDTLLAIGFDGRNANRAYWC